MNTNKLTRIGCIALGVLGVISLFLVFITGDDAIKFGDGVGAITPIILLGQLTLLVAVVITSIYALKGLMADKAKLKSSLMFVGIFLGIVIIAWALSRFAFGFDVETPMRDGKVLSAKGSTLVGTGIIVFYILTIIAVGLMAFPKAVNFLKR
jgi:hypothetical protein